MKNRVYNDLILLIILSLSAVIAQQATQLSSEIGRGVCGSEQYYAFIITCAIPLATPGMTINIHVLRQISFIRCVNGQNFGLAADNSYMWTSSGCVAEFSIMNAVPSTAAPTSTTTSKLTPTTTSTSRPHNLDICGQVGGNISLRIVGGTEAEDCQFPFIVMIYNQRTQTVCGGTIIDSTHILTASHCFIPNSNSWTSLTRKVKANELIVFSGSSNMPFGTDAVNDATRRFVAQIITHENYNNETLENDIAILKLREAIVFDRCHKPICLVDGSKTPQQATNCRSMGWGLTSNEDNAGVQKRLKYVDLPVVSDDACRRVYGTLSSDRTFCAGANGKDSCQGDSGGPFTCKETDGKYYLYGVVSAGIHKNCGNSLGIYTNLAPFLQWINSNTI